VICTVVRPQLPPVRELVLDLEPEVGAQRAPEPELMVEPERVELVAELEELVAEELVAEELEVEAERAVAEWVAAEWVMEKWVEWEMAVAAPVASDEPRKTASRWHG